MKELSFDQERIREILIRCAKNRTTTCLSRVGCKIGRPTRGRWKDDLDAIMRYEEARGRPDPTLVVVLKGKGLPSVYKGEKLKPSDRERVWEYENDRERLFEEWGKAS